MIATRRRMATHDFLLVVFSVVVMVLSWWPEPDPRQIVEIRDSGDQLQHYSLRVDDPRLASLRRELARGSNQSPTTLLAQAKWRAEIAEFYAERTAATANQSQEVVRVSFTDKQPPTDAAESSELLAQHEYWLRFRDQAESQIASAEKMTEQQRSAPPRIVIGAVTSGSHPPLVFVLAGMIGLCVAFVFAYWTYVCPAIRLESDLSTPESLSSPSDSETQSAELESGQLRLAIPPHWVRLHQPAAVHLRRSVFTAVVVVGLVCVFVV